MGWAEGRISRRGLAAVALLIAGCKSDDGPKLKLRPQSSASPDRLSDDEVLPGREEIFGIEVPRGMRVSSRFADFAMLTGHARPEAVANYFREHVLARHVEVGANQTVFPRVYVKGDESKRIYRIEIAHSRNRTTVSMRDITPPPETHGLSEQERWDKAGRNPDGTQKDRLKAR